MTNLRTKLLILGTVACVLGTVQTAAAAVQPAGTGEPLYTNSAQNSQWFEWPATTGIGGYKVQYSYYENNTLVADPTVNPSPNGASNVWANWSGVKTLQHGGQYGVCAQGSYTFPNDSMWISDGPNSCSMGTMLGRRAYTTIDRSKPSTSVALAGGAAATKDAKVAIQVNFADDVAGPFPANFMCFQFGGTSNICDSNAGFIYGYTSACSVPGGGGKSTTFTCTADFGSGEKPAPDGPVWACVIAADAAIPDNPSGPNQSQSAEKANLSDAKCDGVLLDRKAPSVSIDGATSAKVGDLVAFGAQASDATSGVAGSFDWSFGDNTAGATGGSVNHTFTAPGTYEVRVNTTDAAGNQGSATKTVTVSARTTTGGSTGGGSAGGGSTAGGGSPPGGGSTSAVQVSAPRKLKARAKSLPVTLTTDTAGKASFALVRSGRVVARGSKAIGAGTASYKLKLPRKAKAGKYVLKVTFTPTGGKASTKTIKVQLAGKAKAAKASTSAGHRARVSAAGAPSGLPNGVFHGPRKRGFVPRARAAYAAGGRPPREAAA
jgi:plastocyanin